MLTRHLRRAPVLAGLMAGLLLLAACGDDSGDNGGGNSGGGQAAGKVGVILPDAGGAGPDWGAPARSGP